MIHVHGLRTHHGPIDGPWASIQVLEVPWCNILVQALMFQKLCLRINPVHTPHRHCTTRASPIDSPHTVYYVLVSNDNESLLMTNLYTTRRAVRERGFLHSTQCTCEMQMRQPATTMHTSGSSISGLFLVSSIIRVFRTGVLAPTTMCSGLHTPFCSTT